MGTTAHCLSYIALPDTFYEFYLNEKKLLLNEKKNKQLHDSQGEKQKGF